jgi:tetratricopeptide (TPR) repeat protein
MDDPPGPHRGPACSAEITSSQGFQVGEGNVQHNTFNFLFGGGQPVGPVVAGNVPQEPPAFQPREDLMARLRAAGSGVSVVRAVTGMRGVGKTQLAAAYARECINAGWRLVAWVSAEETAGILNGLAVVADRLGVSHSGVSHEMVAGEVRNRLEADGSRCLIVFDNVIDPNSVRPYTPSAGNCQVIVTSTQANAVTLGRPTQIGVFTEDQSLAFLAERTGIDDRVGARALADEVGHLPLALAQAAAVIQAQQLTYQVYVERLRSYPAQRYLPTAEGEQYPRGVAEAIGLSVDAVTAVEPAGLCATLLAVVSLLSPEGVSRQFLYAGRFGEAGLLGAGPEEIDSALGQLVNASLFSFTQGDNSGPLLMAHRLVMRIVRERLVDNGLLGGVIDVILDAFAAADEPLSEFSWDRPMHRELGRHVRSLGGFVDRRQTLLSPTQLSLVANLLYWRRARQVEEADYQLTKLIGLIRTNYRLSRKSYRLKRQNYRLKMKIFSLSILLDNESTDGDPNIDADLDIAGDQDLTRHEYRDSIQWYRDERIRWKDDLVSLMHDLEERYAFCIHKETRYQDKVLAQNNLAYGYAMAGRVYEAVSLYRRSLDDLTRHLGEEHPLTLAARNNLAYALQGSRQGSAAIPLYEESLAAFERALGTDHPHTAIVRHNLANALQEGEERTDQPAG